MQTMPVGPRPSIGIRLRSCKPSGNNEHCRQNGKPGRIITKPVLARPEIEDMHGEIARAKLARTLTRLVNRMQYLSDDELQAVAEVVYPLDRRLQRAAVARS
jgi:hypothetical protein